MKPIKGKEKGPTVPSSAVQSSSPFQQFKSSAQFKVRVHYKPKVLVHPRLVQVQYAQHSKSSTPIQSINHTLIQHSTPIHYQYSNTPIQSINHTNPTNSIHPIHYSNTPIQSKVIQYSNHATPNSNPNTLLIQHYIPFQSSDPTPLTQYATQT